MLISLHPGINQASIIKLMKMKTGSVIYHLDQLEYDDKMIRTEKRGMYRLYFSAATGKDVKVDSGQYLRETQKKILATVAEQKEATQSSISEALRMKQPLVSYHLKRLLEKNLIRRRGFAGFYTYLIQ